METYHYSAKLDQAPVGTVIVWQGGWGRAYFRKTANEPVYPGRGNSTWEYCDEKGELLNSPLDNLKFGSDQIWLPVREV